MAAACEALRLVDGHGLTAEERSRVGEPDVSEGDKEVGRLYRIAMRKDDIWKDGHSAEEWLEPCLDEVMEVEGSIAA
ncbi:hypothetical protein LTR54_016408 [Friedmanniomyces endolithicus]|nr:hypothetical protein LTS00_005904 [Friedmanniomyces endolithicus]KAK0976781.1 hypothetical protein LTR54_016408 [Friedmanniomyces endolithicus]